MSEHLQTDLPNIDRRRNNRLTRITTIWTLVRKAHGPNEDQALKAQHELIERYQGAVYRYLLGAVGNEESADELFQQFVMRFLRGRFRNVDPKRGRFRDYLKRALVNLVTDHRKLEAKHQRLLKATEVEPTAPDEQELKFLESWRQELCARAWDALLQAEQTARQPMYTVLKARAENPRMTSALLADHVTNQLKLNKPMTDVALRKTLQRARKKFAELLLDEVAQSLPGETLDAVEDELIEIGLVAYCQGALNRRRGQGS